MFHTAKALKAFFERIMQFANADVRLVVAGELLLQSAKHLQVLRTDRQPLLASHFFCDGRRPAGWRKRITREGFSQTAC